MLVHKSARKFNIEILKSKICRLAPLMFRVGRSLAVLSALPRWSSSYLLLSSPSTDSFLGASQWVTRSYSQTFLSVQQQNHRHMSSSGNANDDEVSKAIEAAAKASIADTEPSTIFDKIVAGDIPCDKVYEDDTVLAFRDINPQAPVHILVIPKDRQGLSQLSKAVGANKAVLGELLFVAGQIGEKECPKGFRLVINDGADGAQSVYHLHIHIMGGRQMGWPPG